MNINTNNLIPISDANQNFSKVARMVDTNGSVVILKNNKPKYIIMEFNTVEEEQIANNEDLISISKRIMNKNKKAYKVLAK